MHTNLVTFEPRVSGANLAPVLYPPPPPDPSSAWKERLRSWLGLGSSELDRLRAENALLAHELDLQRQRLEQLHRLSTTDELTGLSNRRGFELALRHALDAARRHDDGGAIAYLDCDDFKMINDRYGHAAGDAALMALAAILKRDTRSTDHVARLHGDEFAVLLVRSGVRHGTARLRLMEHIVNQTMIAFKGQNIPVRVSMGIVGYEAHDDFEDLIQRADRSMYERKQVRRQPILMSAAE
jgi:diguanylate cyclase (GGDEF)-like protein